MILTQKELDYKKILISICEERGLDGFVSHIEKYVGVAPVVKYNITKLPEAVCDGCEG